jgi:hypothetical protein
MGTTVHCYLYQEVTSFLSDPCADLYTLNAPNSECRLPNNHLSKPIKVEVHWLALWGTCWVGWRSEILRIDQRSLMFYATTTRKCLPRIFVLPSFRHITDTKNPCVLVLTRCHVTDINHVLTPCHVIEINYVDRWSWRGGAHAAAVQNCISYQDLIGQFRIFPITAILLYVRDITVNSDGQYFHSYVQYS